MAWIGLAISAVSAVVGANKAADSHSQAHTAEGRAAAIFDAQADYRKQLDDLMKNPNKVTELPNYNFNFEQGAEALNRKMGAGGFHGSGNLGAGLVKFGQDYARNAYDDQVKLLASMSGLQTATSPATYSGLAGEADKRSYDQLGQSLAALGYMTKMGGGAGSTPAGTGGGGGSGSPGVLGGNGYGSGADTMNPYIYHMNDLASGNDRPLNA